VLQWLVVLLLAVQPVEAQTLGGAFLASGNSRFPCSKVVKWHKRIGGEVYHATLWRSFGESKRCYKRLFALKQPVTLQFYLSNEAGRRNRTLESVDLLPALDVFTFNALLETGARAVISRVQSRAASIWAFCEAHTKQGDRCLLALGLESNFTKGAALAVAKAVKSAGWHYRDLVYNPAYFYRGTDVTFYYEQHSLQQSPVSAKRTIISLDGNHFHKCQGRSNYDQISTAELRYWFNTNRVHYFGAWCFGWQGNGQCGRRSKRAFSVGKSELNQFLEIWRSVYGNSN
jgi:hypothetical protein